VNEVAYLTSPSGNQILYTHCSCWYVRYSFEVASSKVDPVNNWDIPHSHSSALFDAFLDPLLLESPTNTESSIIVNTSDLDAVLAQLTLRNARRQELVSRVNIPNFGTLDEFTASGRKVALLKIAYEKHDIPKVEGLQDAIGRMQGECLIYISRC
jgi:hypothetical protein